MHHYAPIPTDYQLARLGDDLGYPIEHLFRIEAGLACTMDMLRDDRHDRRLILRRYWLPESDETIDPAEGELSSLDLAARFGIPAPEAVWIDRIGLFPHRAMVITFLEGRINLTPDDPLDWAFQLAEALVAVHLIQPAADDLPFLARMGRSDDHEPETEEIEAHLLGVDLWARREEMGRSYLPVEPTFLHHDFWPGNTLWRDSDLVAVIDWEGSALGDPALDVAYCAVDIRYLGLDDAARHFVSEYKRLSERELVNFDYWYLTALLRPMPDIAMWASDWRANGIEMTDDQARARHSALIAEALRA